MHTSYKQKTHNLGKFKRYAKRFFEELDKVFPNSSAKEYLLDLLKRGYVDTLYTVGYSISPADVSILIER